MPTDADSASGYRNPLRRASSFQPVHRDEPKVSDTVSPSVEFLSNTQSTVAYPSIGPQPVPSAVASSAALSNAEWFDTVAPAAANGLGDRARRQIQHLLADQVAPVRLAGHFAVLLVAALILILSQVEVPEWELSLQTSSEAAGSEQAPNVLMQVSGLIGRSDASEREYLPKAAVPFTVIQDRHKDELRAYIVQSGDTVLGIAEKLGLQPETIQWANASLELNPDLIRPGDQLVILPMDGSLHVVRPGDTLLSIAQRYKVDVTTIVGYEPNSITDPAAPIAVGTQLVIPGGIKPVVRQQVVEYTGESPADASKGLGSFVWPTSGSINQKYWSGHPALDIGAWAGAPVTAADSGYVALATGGWNAGYGNHIIIDHGNGFVTLYAHLNSIFVRPGESVASGQQIGSVGNTGNSTGSHLHFEIRYQGVQRNPFNYLP